MLAWTVAEFTIKGGKKMEIDAIYVMGTARKCFRLHELLASLEESFEVAHVQCVVIRNDYTVDMRVAFTDPAKARATVTEKMLVDDKGYSWVRFVNMAWVPRPTEPGDWTIAYKGPSIITGYDTQAILEELLAE